jgi:hypothetical protein
LMARTPCVVDTPKSSSIGEMAENARLPIPARRSTSPAHFATWPYPSPRNFLALLKWCRRCVSILITRRIRALPCQLADKGRPQKRNCKPFYQHRRRPWPCLAVALHSRPTSPSCPEDSGGSSWPRSAALCFLYAQIITGESAAPMRRRVASTS